MYGDTRRNLHPLYVSPIGKGGVDLGIQNITRSVQRAGHSPMLRRLPHWANFAPFAAPLLLGPRWWQGFDIVQGRSRVAWALKRRGLPLVTTVHHLTTDPQLQPYSSPAQRLFYHTLEYLYDGLSIKRADGVVCVSRYTQQQTALVYGKLSTTVVYDGIDTDVFVPTADGGRSDHGLPTTNARIRLLFVGNRTRRKGFDLLPQIMDRLPLDHTLFYTESFQTVQAAPPHPRMVPIGTPDRAGLVAAYQSCDLLLFPTRVEGFGIVAAEAGACGRPVVTTDAGALPEVVDDGVTGYLCRRDDIDDYVEKITRLADDLQLRSAMGVAARAKIVAQFGYEQLALGLLDVYQQLLSTGA
ncbi:MAG: glycosyltransferase family 4 protein [Herpetosiphonaceae bacterium]|nr:glycosyltransferase family 4 protein [Herpetosiphonaceae bacterium]